MREVLRGIAKVAVGLVLLTIGNIAFFIGYLMQKSPLMIIPLAIAAVCYVAIWYLCETCEEEKTLTMKENYQEAAGQISDEVLEAYEEQQARRLAKKHRLRPVGAGKHFGVFHCWEQFRMGQYGWVQAVVEHPDGRVVRYKADEIVFLD